MNDELRVEDYETRLCALPSSRKAGVRPGRRNARLLAVALRRAGTVTARSFVGRRSKGNDGWIGVKTPSEGIDLKRENWPPGRHFGSLLGHPSRRTADLAAERPKGFKNLYFIGWYGIYL